MTDSKPPARPRKLKPDPALPETSTPTVSMRSRATVPIILLIVTMALANAGTWYSLKVQGVVLNTQVEHMGDHLAEIKELVRSTSEGTNKELAKLRDEITALKVKVAAIEARGG